MKSVALFPDDNFKPKTSLRAIGVPAALFQLDFLSVMSSTFHQGVPYIKKITAVRITTFFFHLIIFFCASSWVGQVACQET